MDEHKWHHFIFVCMCVDLTWAGLDYDAHPPPDGVKVQNMEQLKPVDSHPGVIHHKELVSSLAAHFACLRAAHQCQVCLRQASNLRASTYAQIRIHFSASEFNQPSS